MCQAVIVFFFSQTPLTLHKRIRNSTGVWKRERDWGSSSGEEKKGKKNTNRCWVSITFLFIFFHFSFIGRFHKNNLTERKEATEREKEAPLPSDPWEKFGHKNVDRLLAVSITYISCFLCSTDLMLFPYIIVDLWVNKKAVRGWRRLRKGLFFYARLQQYKPPLHKRNLK